MARKRIPTSTNSPAAATALLDDDEELVEETTTTKKIGRQRRTPAAEAEPITPPADFIDIDDDGDEIEQPAFSQTSLAAMIYGEDGETFEDKFCTVAVRRKPDTMRDKFAVPCSAVTNLPRLSNIALATEQADIEDQVRSEYGGGHYFFQIYFEGRLGRTWQATLSDLPGWKPPTAEPTHEPTPAVIAAPAANPMDTFLADLERTKRLKEALFGDDQKRYEDSIASLRAELEAAKTATSNEPPMSEELLMWKMAKDMPESEAKNRLLDKLMPADSDGNRHWIVDAAALALENKDAIIGVVGSIFGGLMQPQQPTQPTNIADMMRAPAPAGLPSRPSVFAKKPEPAPAEPPPPAEPIAEPVTEAADISKGDETAIEAEIVTEEPKKNERRKRTAA